MNLSAIQYNCCVHRLMWRSGSHISFRKEQEDDVNTITCPGENSYCVLYWLGSTTLNLCHNLVEGVVFFLMCCTLLGDLGNFVQNHCMVLSVGHADGDVRTVFLVPTLLATTSFT
jgi:hypothetical protein